MQRGANNPGGLGGFPPNELRNMFPSCLQIVAVVGGVLGGNPPKPPGSLHVFA